MLDDLEYRRNALIVHRVGLIVISLSMHYELAKVGQIRRLNHSLATAPACLRARHPPATAPQ